MIEPAIFRPLGKQPANFVNVKVAPTNLPSTMIKIENAWKKIDKVHGMEATFYDEEIEQAYSEFSSMIKIIGFLAFLAISIASLGLFGMGVALNVAGAGCGAVTGSGTSLVGISVSFNILNNPLY